MDQYLLEHPNTPSWAAELADDFEGYEGFNDGQEDLEFYDSCEDHHDQEEYQDKEVHQDYEDHLQDNEDDEEQPAEKIAANDPSNSN